MSEIHIGRLLRANTRGCVAGCQINQPFPAFGSLVSIPLYEADKAFGLVTDIHIDDDGLVRQLAASDSLPEEIIEDNRLNRNAPVELSVLFIGCSTNGTASHLLPARPPLSLDRIFTCSDDLIRAFTSFGRFGYLRHILGAQDLPTADLLAAHLMQAGRAQADSGNSEWVMKAIQEIIILLRDDHGVLTAVLGAIADAFPGFSVQN